MHLEKCLLQIKVLRLLILFGAFSSVVVLIIFSFPNNEETTVTSFNQIFLDTLALRSPIKSQTRNEAYATKNTRSFFSNYGNRELTNRKVVAHRNNVSIRDKMKNFAVHTMKTDDLILSKNAAIKLSKQNIRNIHIFYTFSVEWFDSFDHSNVSSQNHIKQPPNTAFYPLYGLYTSNNKTLRYHFEKIKSLGASVLIITWSPSFQKHRLHQIFKEIEKFNLQIAIEIDDYPNRNVSTLFDDVQYFFDEFWHHGGFYKVFSSSKNKYMPMFYVKNIDTISNKDWLKLLASNDILSIRNSHRDAVFIGHIR